MKSGWWELSRGGGMDFPGWAALWWGPHSLPTAALIYSSLLFCPQPPSLTPSAQGLMVASHRHVPMPLLNTPINPLLEWAIRSCWGPHTDSKTGAVGSPKVFSPITDKTL